MFPIWPNTSPQNPYKILGNGTQRGLEELQGAFVVPEFRDTDVPIRGRPALSTQSTGEKNGQPVYGSVNNSALFDMFYQSTQQEPASQIEPPKTGKA